MDSESNKTSGCITQTTPREEGKVNSNNQTKESRNQKWRRWKTRQTRYDTKTTTQEGMRKYLKALSMLHSR